MKIKTNDIKATHNKIIPYYQNVWDINYIQKRQV